MGVIGDIFGYIILSSIGIIYLGLGLLGYRELSRN